LKAFGGWRLPRVLGGTGVRWHRAAALTGARLFLSHPSQVGILGWTATPSAAPAASRRRRLQHDGPPARVGVGGGRDAAGGIGALITLERSEAAQLWSLRRGAAGTASDGAAPAQHPAQGLRALLAGRESLVLLARQGAFDEVQADGPGAAGAAGAAGADGAHRRSLQMLVLGGDGAWQALNTSGASGGGGGSSTGPGDPALQALTAPGRPGPPEDGGGDGEVATFGVASGGGAAPPFGPEAPVVADAVPLPGAPGGGGGGNTPGALAAAAVLAAAHAASNPPAPVSVRRGFKRAAAAAAPSPAGGPAAAAAALRPAWHAGGFGRDLPARGLPARQAADVVRARMQRGQALFLDAAGRLQASDGAGAASEAVHAYPAAVRRLMSEGAGGSDGGSGDVVGGDGVVALAAAPAGKAGAGAGAGASASASASAGGAAGSGNGTAGSSNATQTGEGAGSAAGAAVVDSQDLTAAFKSLVSPRAIVVGPHRPREAGPGPTAALAGQPAGAVAAAGPGGQGLRRARQLQMLVLGEDGTLQPFNATVGSRDATSDSGTLSSLAAPARPPAGVGSVSSAVAAANRSSAATGAFHAAASEPAISPPAGQLPPGLNASAGFKRGGGVGTSGGPAPSPALAPGPGSPGDGSAPGTYGGDAEPMHAFPVAARRRLATWGAGGQGASAPPSGATVPPPAGRGMLQAAPSRVLLDLKITGFASDADAASASDAFRAAAANGSLSAAVAAQGWAGADLSLVSVEARTVAVPGTGGGGGGGGAGAPLSPLSRPLLIAVVGSVGGLLCALLAGALIVRRQRRATAMQLAAGHAAASAPHQLPPAAAGPSGGASQRPHSQSAYPAGRYPPVAAAPAQLPPGFGAASPGGRAGSQAAGLGHYLPAAAVWGGGGGAAAAGGYSYVAVGGGVAGPRVSYAGPQAYPPADPARARQQLASGSSSRGGSPPGSGCAGAGWPGVGGLGPSGGGGGVGGGGVPSFLADGWRR
jgi:hypothetical protein